MSIKENQLPTAQEVTENNLIRTVDENGASQNMTVDQLGGLVGGGGNLVLTETVTSDGDIETHTLSATYNEMINAINNGGLLIVVDNVSSDGMSLVSPVILGLSYLQVTYQGRDSFPMYTENVTPIGPAGYYFRSPWGDGPQYFYSSTADGVMTYKSAK